jgi:hypothetical protein
MKFLNLFNQGRSGQINDQPDPDTQVQNLPKSVDNLKPKTAQELKDLLLSQTTSSITDVIEFVKGMDPTEIDSAIRYYHLAKLEEINEISTASFDHLDPDDSNFEEEKQKIVDNRVAQIKILDVLKERLLVELVTKPETNPNVDPSAALNSVPNSDIEQKFAKELENPYIITSDLKTYATNISKDKIKTAINDNFEKQLNKIQDTYEKGKIRLDSLGLSAEDYQVQYADLTNEKVNATLRCEGRRGDLLNELVLDAEHPKSKNERFKMFEGIKKMGDALYKFIMDDETVINANQSGSNFDSVSQRVAARRLNDSDSMFDDSDSFDLSGELPPNVAATKTPKQNQIPDLGFNLARHREGYMFNKNEGITTLENTSSEQNRNFFAGIKNWAQKLDPRKVDWKAVGENAKENKGLILATGLVGGLTIYASLPLAASSLLVGVGGTQAVAGFLGAAAPGTFASLGLGSLTGAATTAWAYTGIGATFTAITSGITINKLFQKPVDYKANQNETNKSFASMRKNMTDFATSHLKGDKKTEKNFDQSKVDNFIDTVINDLYIYLLQTKQIQPGDPIPELFKIEGKEWHGEGFLQDRVRDNTEHFLKDSPDLQTPTLASPVTVPTVPHAPQTGAAKPDAVKSSEDLESERKVFLKSKMSLMVDEIRSRDKTKFTDTNRAIIQTFVNNLAEIEKSFVDNELVGDTFLDEIENELPYYNINIDNILDEQKRSGWSEQKIDDFAHAISMVMRDYTGEVLYEQLLDNSNLVDFGKSISPKISQKVSALGIKLPNRLGQQIIQISNEEVQNGIDYIKNNLMRDHAGYLTSTIGVWLSEAETLVYKSKNTIPPEYDKLNKLGVDLTTYADIVADKIVERLSKLAEEARLEEEAKLEEKNKKEVIRADYLTESAKGFIENITNTNRNGKISLNNYTILLMGKNMHENISNYSLKLGDGKNIYDLIQDKLGPDFDFNNIGDLSPAEILSIYTEDQTNQFATAALEVLSELSGLPVPIETPPPVVESTISEDLASGVVTDISTKIEEIKTTLEKPINQESKSLYLSDASTFMLGLINEREADLFPTQEEFACAILSLLADNVSKDPEDNETFVTLIAEINKELNGEYNLFKDLGAEYRDHLSTGEKNEIGIATLAVLNRLSQKEKTPAEPIIDDSEVELALESFPQKDVPIEISDTSIDVSSFENIVDQEEIDFRLGEIARDILTKAASPKNVSENEYICEQLGYSLIILRSERYPLQEKAIHTAFLRQIQDVVGKDVVGKDVFDFFNEKSSLNLINAWSDREMIAKKTITVLNRLAQNKPRSVVENVNQEVKEPQTNESQSSAESISPEPADSLESLISTPAAAENIEPTPSDIPTPFETTRTPDELKQLQFLKNEAERVYKQIDELGYSNNPESNTDGIFQVFCDNISPMIYNGNTIGHNKGQGLFDEIGKECGFGTLALVHLDLPVNRYARLTTTQIKALVAATMTVLNRYKDLEIPETQVTDNVESLLSSAIVPEIVNSGTLEIDDITESGRKEYIKTFSLRLIAELQGKPDSAVVDYFKMNGELLEKVAPELFEELKKGSSNLSIINNLSGDKQNLEWAVSEFIARLHTVLYEFAGTPEPIGGFEKKVTQVANSSELISEPRLDVDKTMPGMTEFEEMIFSNAKLKNKFGLRTTPVSYLTEYFDTQAELNAQSGIDYPQIQNSIVGLFRGSAVKNYLAEKNSAEFFEILRDTDKFGELMNILNDESRRTAKFVQQFISPNLDTPQSKATKQYMDALENYIKTGEMPKAVESPTDTKSKVDSDYKAVDVEVLPSDFQYLNVNQSYMRNTSKKLSDEINRYLVEEENFTSDELQNPETLSSEKAEKRYIAAWYRYGSVKEGDSYNNRLEKLGQEIRPNWSLARMFDGSVFNPTPKSDQILIGKLILESIKSDLQGINI